MKKIICIVLCFLLTVGIFSGCGEKTPEAQPFKVGFARGDITPSESVLMGGFYDPDERFSNEVLDKIYATGVAFSDTKGNKLLIICVDLLNTDATLFEGVRKIIAEENNIPFANVMITASHTHSAPHQDSGNNTNSNNRIREACIKLAKEAFADLKPAQMYTTFTRPERMNFVRHYVMADGSYLGRRVGYEPESQLVGHVHKADNLMQLVKFTREGGKDVILTNWQAHYKGATSVNYNGVSADYPGIYRQVLEETLDCHAAFILGGAGNLVSSSKLEGWTRTADYREHGKVLAEIAAEAAANFKPAELGDIYVKESNFKVEGSQKNIPLYAAGFGDFGCAFAPFEIFDTNARNVREASKWTYTFYASCSNAGTGMMYLPDAAGFTYPTYEALGSQEIENPNYTPFPAGTAEKVQDELISMLNTIFAESGNTEKTREDGYMSTPIEPATDGKVYTNSKVGDASAVTEGKNGLYCMQLVADGRSLKNVLIASKELADQILQKQEMKLLFDERNVIVGILE